MTTTINSSSCIGAVALGVTDLDRAAKFYTSILGMTELSTNQTGVWRLFGVGEQALIRLTHAGSALDPRLPGLYHMAILMPDRVSLARVLFQLAESNYAIQGASDHGVSEALYLADPLGNGIELYADRPRGEWPHLDDGSLDMATGPLNIDRLLFTLKDRLEPWNGLDPRTRMGHVHLQVSDLAAAEDFYTRVLGLELMQHYGDEAAFVSAGDYHHHVGLNTWNSRGSAPAPADAAGLRYFELLLPDAASLAEVTARVKAEALPAEPFDGGWLVRDPAGNGVLLKVGE